MNTYQYQEKGRAVVRIVLLLAVLSFAGVCAAQKKAGEQGVIKTVNQTYLPKPNFKGTLTVEQAIGQRRSARSFKQKALNLEEVSQILWSAQGITDKKRNYRSAPSAGALYPLEIFLVAGNVDGITKGIYRYLPKQHILELVQKGEFRYDLAKSCLSQDWIEDSPASIVIASVPERTKRKYGDRGSRYVHFEAGHASQNIYLMCEALEMGTVAVGAFNDAAVAKLLQMKESEEPLYVMPVGKKP